MNHILGEELRRRRKENQFTLKDLARAAGISVGFACDIENGRRSCSLDTLARFASALGCSVTSFMVPQAAVDQITPHDLFAAAALIGILMRQDIGSRFGNVSAAFLYADEAMKQRGQK
jgi:transcriptional regulator with XRE-family HTH domain